MPIRPENRARYPSVRAYTVASLARARERFCTKYCVAASGCWEWTGGFTRGGYGRFRMGSVADGTRGQRRAHRVSWELFHGPIPNGYDVCHACDNPPCVNPDHLFLGTRKDNMVDMRRKGRAAANERHPQAKLTDGQVAEIRALGGTMPQHKIGSLFGVDQRHISRILSGSRRVTERGRTYRGVGSTCFKAKLDDDTVRAIRASSETTTAWAHRLGVSVATISRARSGRAWKHVG